MPVALCPRTVMAAAVLPLCLFVAGPAAAAPVQPTVGFWFGAAPSADADPAAYVAEKAAGPQVFGTADSSAVRQGWGRVSLPEGLLSLSFREDRYGNPYDVAFNSSGDGVATILYDALVAGASGTLTLTLSAHAALSASDLTLASAPLLDDDSWAGYSFGLYAEVFNPGSGAYSGGGGQARTEIADATHWAVPSPTAAGAGTAGQRKAITASVAPDGSGGTLTLTAWVNAGDRLWFSAVAGAVGWTDSMPGAYAVADLSHTGRLSVSGSPGMTWTSESGVFLSAQPNAVPEPPAVLLLASGLAGWFTKRRAPGARCRQPRR